MSVFIRVHVAEEVNELTHEHTWHHAMMEREPASFRFLLVLVMFLSCLDALMSCRATLRCVANFAALHKDDLCVFGREEPHAHARKRQRSIIVV